MQLLEAYQIKFTKLIFITTLLTIAIVYIFYSWEQNYGLTIAVTALGHGHFLLAYFFSYEIFSKWIKQKKFWHNITLLAIIVLAVYVIFYRLIGGDMSFLQRLLIIYFFSFLYFALHNARDVIAMFKEYNNDHQRNSWTEKNILFIGIILSICAALGIKFFFGTSFGNVYAEADYTVLFNGNNQFLGNIYYSLIVLTVIVSTYIAINYFIIRQRINGMLTAILAVILLATALLTVVNFKGIDVLNFIILWHFMLWYVFFVEKIKFFQKKFAGTKIPTDKLTGLAGIIFKFRKTPLNFLSLTITVNLIIVLIALYFVKAYSLESTAVINPVFGLYWFSLYSVAHISFSFFPKNS